MCNFFLLLHVYAKTFKFFVWTSLFDPPICNFNGIIIPINILRKARLGKINSLLLCYLVGWEQNPRFGLQPLHSIFHNTQGLLNPDFGKSHKESKNRGLESRLKLYGRVRIAWWPKEESSWIGQWKVRGGMSSRRVMRRLTSLWQHAVTLSRC